MPLPALLPLVPAAAGAAARGAVFAAPWIARGVRPAISGVRSLVSRPAASAATKTVGRSKSGRVGRTVVTQAGSGAAGFSLGTAATGLAAGAAGYAGARALSGASETVNRAAGTAASLGAAAIPAALTVAALWGSTQVPDKNLRNGLRVAGGLGAVWTLAAFYQQRKREQER